MYGKRDYEEYEEKVQNLFNIVTVDSKLTFFSQIFRGGGARAPSPPPCGRLCVFINVEKKIGIIIRTSFISPQSPSPQCIRQC